MPAQVSDTPVTFNRSPHQPSAPPRAGDAAPEAPVADRQPRANPPGAAFWEVPLAVATGALGLWLGVVNQGAGSTDMALRLPCLLAALLMAGQAVLNLVRVGRGVQPVKGRVSPAVPAVLIGLAVWLGWADLHVKAPDQLTQLALTSAFVLFALGWWLLGDRT